MDCGGSMDNKIHIKLAREKATIALYQYLLIDASNDDLLDYLNNDEELIEEDDISFSKSLIQTAIDNKTQYINLINKYLKKNWSFDRLPKMEQAILLIATEEILESDLPKQIIVNEAINNTKKYCDASSYKYINAVLGNIN